MYTCSRISCICVVQRTCRHRQTTARSRRGYAWLFSRPAVSTPHHTHPALYSYTSILGDVWLLAGVLWASSALVVALPCIWAFLEIQFYSVHMFCTRVFVYPVYVLYRSWVCIVQILYVYCTDSTYVLYRLYVLYVHWTEDVQKYIDDSQLQEGVRLNPELQSQRPKP